MALTGHCVHVLVCSRSCAGAGKGILDVTIVPPQAGAEAGALGGQNALSVIPVKAHLTKRAEDVTVVEARLLPLPLSLSRPFHSILLL